MNYYFLIFYLFFFFSFCFCSNKQKPICDVLNSKQYTKGKWIFDESLLDNHQKKDDIPLRKCKRLLYWMNQAQWFRKQERVCDLFGSKNRKGHFKWQPDDCDLLSYNSTLFWQVLNHKRLQFVGDSITSQQQLDLRCSIENAELIGKNQHTRTTKGEVFHIDDNKTLLSVVGNVARSKYLFNLHRDQMFPDQLDHVWSNQISNDKAILILNTGAWWSFNTPMGKAVCADCNLNRTDDRRRMKTALRHTFESTMTTLFDTLTNASATIMFRSLAPGHKDCTPKFATYQAWWFWNEFEWRNAFVEREISRVNVQRTALNLTKFYYLDVFELSRARDDDHPGSRGLGTDCLHYCVPSLQPHSTVGEWNSVLLTALVNLYESDVAWRDRDFQIEKGRHPKHHPLSELV